MAAKYEKTNTQLMAIYKLEFYKNKKNWKLFEKMKKEQVSRPQSPNSKLCDCSRLNRTYSLEDVHAEPEYDTEQSPLNQAFLHDEPGGTEDEEVPDFLPAEFDLPEPATQCLFQHQWGDHERMWGDLQQPEWCGAQTEGMPEELAYDHCDGPYHRDLWPPVYEAPPAGAAPPGLPAAELLKAAEILKAADCFLQDTHCTHSEIHESLDESEEFIRGAHAAPHSSELELKDGSHECVCVRELYWRLSNAQLVRALHVHRAALAALLHEATKRGTQFTQSSSQPTVPLDVPVRDTDPPAPPAPPADLLLGGSHRAGRGRGRLHLLHNNLCGIGRGRPYML